MNPRQWRPAAQELDTPLRVATLQALHLIEMIRSTHEADMRAKKWPHTAGGPMTDAIDALRGALGIAKPTAGTVEVEAHVLPVTRLRQGP